MRGVTLRQLAILTLVLVGAACVRGHDLDRQSIWLDEAASVSFAERDLVSCALDETQHPPLYRTLLHLVIRGLGDSENALRSLPLVFGILTLIRKDEGEAELTDTRSAIVSTFSLVALMELGD